MVSLGFFPKRLLARSKQILWRFVRGVNGQIPPSPRRYKGQTEIDRLGSGIEHQQKGARLIFMDQTGEMLFFRVGPVGQSPLGAKPMNLGIRVELPLTQNRMGTTKGDHATGEAENIPVPF